jgi:hypothetical protein
MLWGFMKRSFLLPFFFLLMFSVLFSNENKNAKIWKFFKMDQKSIIITDDLEIWELNYLKQNKESWNEWFFNKSIDLIDEKYTIKKFPWKDKDVFLIEDYSWIKFRESINYRNDQSDLELCTHLMTNIQNQEKAFARQIFNVEEFLIIYNNFLKKHSAAQYLRSDDAVELTNQHIPLLFFFTKNINERIKYLDKKDYDEKYIKFDHLYEFSRIKIISKK